MKNMRKIGLALAIPVIAGVALALWFQSEPSIPPGSPESAPDKQVWRYTVWGPRRAFTEGIERVKAIMEEAAPERFEMQIHYASALVPTRGLLDALKIGVVESGATCIGYHHGKTPLAQVLELPFLLTEDFEANVKIQDAVFRHPLIEQEFAKWNAKYLMPTILPTFEFMGNSRIARVEDLEGVRMRISGANQLLLRKYGAIPVMVTPPETYIALERGTIDMIGFPWTYAHGAYRLQEVSKFATEGMAMTGFACLSLVSLEAWEALPQSLQALLPRLSRESERAMIDAYRKADALYLPIFKERLEVVPFSPDERRKLVAASESVWNDWAAEKEAKGLPGAEILAFAKAQVARFRGE